MPTEASSSVHHAIKSLTLIAISLVILPLTTLILLISYSFRPPIYLYRILQHVSPNTLRRRLQAPATSKPSRRTILVTGVGMSKGLALSRIFHRAGHRVVGADVAPFRFVTPCGRFSTAVDKFYNLPPIDDHNGPATYIHELLQIVHQERVDLWVSCSGVASALEDAQAKEVIERRSDCLCIQFDSTTTSILHSKDSFTSHTKNIGLPVPETYNVTSRAAVHKVLHQSPRTKKRYIMKNVGMDDASRGDIMTLLPRRTLSETYNHVAHIPISTQNPWVLQQYVPGKKEYCTHALVIRGKIKAFVACPSSELLMHYEALPHPASSLSRAMLRFTQEFVSRSSERLGAESGARTPFVPMTGHLSFDFLIDEVVTEKGTESILRAIECNPRAHTAVALFRGKDHELAEAYLSLLDEEVPDASLHSSLEPKLNGHARRPLLPSSAPQTEDSEATGVSLHDPEIMSVVTPLPSASKIYWIGHDLFVFFFLPLLHLGLVPLTCFVRAHSLRDLARLILQEYSSSFRSIIQSIGIFLEHLINWHDGTYELLDPLPVWVLYHVYWPGVFARRLWLGRSGWWTRCNVSTVKVFGC